MNKNILKKTVLPDAPGIYIFKDAKKKPLYIGRATSLKDRVKSYFGIDLIHNRGPRIVDMVTKTRHIDFRKTDLVLEAIILENILIKRYQPPYNVDEKDDKSSQYIIITNEDWPRVFLERVRDFDIKYKYNKLDYKIKNKFGPYPHGGLVCDALNVLRKIFPFKDKKSRDSRHDTFYGSLGMSPNCDSIEAKENYKKTIKYLTLFFQGKKSILLKKIKKDMDNFAGDMKFEQAGKMKKLLHALTHINDIALIKYSEKRQNNNIRIEAYDIAHLSGKDVVGAMVVAVGGQFVPMEYRRFKLKYDTNDDVANIAQILFRRLKHSEWTYPDIIVVDGNEVQMRSAENVLKTLRISIPVIAVTKNAKHKAHKLLGHPDIMREHGKNIIALNIEAHRFAISYHKVRRRKSFFDFIETLSQ